jgi:hypothetical protein
MSKVMVGVPAIVFAQLMASRNEQCVPLHTPSSLSSTVFTTMIPPPAMLGAGWLKRISAIKQMTKHEKAIRLCFIVFFPFKASTILQA